MRPDIYLEYLGTIQDNLSITSINSCLAIKDNFDFIEQYHLVLNLTIDCGYFAPVIGGILFVHINFVEVSNILCILDSIEELDGDNIRIKLASIFKVLESINKLRTWNNCNLEDVIKDLLFPLKDNLLFDLNCVDLTVGFYVQKYFSNYECLLSLLRANNLVLRCVVNNNQICLDISYKSDRKYGVYSISSLWLKSLNKSTTLEQRELLSCLSYNFLKCGDIVVTPEGDYIVEKTNVKFEQELIFYITLIKSCSREAHVKNITKYEPAKFSSYDESAVAVDVNGNRDAKVVINKIITPASNNKIVIKHMYKNRTYMYILPIYNDKKEYILIPASFVGKKVNHDVIFQDGIEDSKVSIHNNKICIEGGSGDISLSNMWSFKANEIYFLPESMLVDKCNEFAVDGSDKVEFKIKNNVDIKLNALEVKANNHLLHARDIKVKAQDLKLSSRDFVLESNKIIIDAEKICIGGDAIFIDMGTIEIVSKRITLCSGGSRITLGSDISIISDVRVDLSSTLPIQWLGLVTRI